MKGWGHYSRTTIRPHLHIHNIPHPKRIMGVAQLRTHPLVITIYRRGGRCLGQLPDGDLPQSGFMYPVKRDNRFLQPVRTSLVSAAVLAREVLVRRR